MNSSSNQFGLVVAYLLPGFIGLAGIAPFLPLVATWLAPGIQTEAGLGPPIYAVLAATTIGMILSCFRWLIIDHIHRWMGIVPPVWDDNRLEERVVAFNYLVESHYRYYQFVANTLIAVIFAYSINRSMGTFPFHMVTDIGALVLCAALFATSRDALSKYYVRTSRLVGEVTKKGKDDMMYNYNGNDHKADESVPTHTAPKAKPKPSLAPPPKPDQGKGKATEPAR